MTKSFIKVLGLLLVVGLLFAALPTGQAQAATITVNPGDSIQAAINSAGNGDVIQVAAGTYYGAITINKEVTLQSLDGPATTIIHGGLTENDTMYTVAIRSSNVTFSGFTVTSPNYNPAAPWNTADPIGLSIGYYGDNSLSNIVVNNNWVTQIGSPDRLVCVDCYPSVGIVVNGVVAGLDITNNKVYDIHQTVTDPAVTWGPTGIGFYGYGTTPLSSDVVISGNEVYNISADAGAPATTISNGIRAGYGSGDVTISGNTVHDIDGRAIAVTSSNNGVATISNNTLSNAATGIYLGNAGGGVLSGNTFTNVGVNVEQLPVHNITQSKYYATIEAAVAAAVAGDVVDVAPGTYVIAPITFNQAITLQGQPGAKIQVSGTGERLTFLAGATLTGFEIEKTDKTGVQNIIWINANNVVISDNVFHGQYVMGDGEVARAMVISGGLTGLQIIDNTIYGLRQPAYVTGTTTGIVERNDVYATRGWVLEGGNLTFTGNTWGDGTQPNAVDIAILSSVPATYYTNIMAMSDANSNAVIEDQRSTPAVLADVYVDDSVVTSGNGTPTAPYKTIGEAIPRVAVGGTIHVANGTYTESPNIYKSLSLMGESEAGVIIDATAIAGYSMEVFGDITTTFQNFTLKGNPTTAGSYGLKISGDLAFTTIDHVTVTDSYRSGIDLNGLNGTAVSNVTIRNTRRGVGLALTDCSNVAVSNVTTSGNAWGGMAVYTGNNTTFVHGSDSVSLSGTNSFGESNKLYIETVPGYPVTNFTQTMFPYTVKNGEYLWFVADLTEAASVALGLPAPFDVKSSSIEKLSDGSHYVFNGMTIQAAIDAATAGDVITVAAGTYVEDLVIDKSVTLLGPNATVNPNTGTRVAEAVIQGSGNYASMVVLAEDVTVDGFTFDGQYLTDTYYTIGLEGDASGLTAQNNVFINHKDMAIMTTGVYYDGTAWKYDKYLDAVLLKDNLISNTTLSTSQYNFGIYFQSSLGTVSGNVVTNYRNGIQVQAYNTPGGGTISGNTFETYRTGIYFNYTENASANWLFEENDISGIAYPTGLTAERYNAVRVETMYAGSVAFEDNSILLGTSDATAKYQYFENNVTGGTRDASPNWWGSPCGPAAFSGTAVASPWYADAAMTTLKTATPAGDFSVTPDMTTVALNAALECATPGSTITFTTTSTDVDYPGGIVVPAGRDHLKLLLNDGVVLHGGSPCITVNADYTTIEADNLAMASCVTVAGSNGIDVAAGLRNLTVDGLEITGAGTDGIHFNGVITDVVLKDNYIHDLAGNGVFFGAQPVALSTYGIDIHGNLFQNNGGNGIEAGAFTVPAEYNSWGNVGGAAAGDGASAGVDADPFTHVDLYLVSSGTPWADQVVSGQTITYTVMGHLVNANAADFVLTYPANLTYVSSTASGSFGTDLVTHTAGTRSLHFLGYSTTGNKTGTLPLFSVTFTAGAPVADAPMLLDELTDGFGMAAAGSSSNIYAAALLDSTVTIVTLPTISSTDIQGYYLTGEQRQFSVVLDNPVGGANYAHVYVDFTMTNAQVDQISLIEYSVDGGTTWVALGVGPGTSFANVGTDIVGFFGKVDGGGFALAPNTSLTTLFRVTFVTRDATVDLPTSYAVSMKLMDADVVPTALQLDDLAATMYVYDKPTVTYTSDPYFIVGEPGNFAVTITNPVTGKNYANTVVFDVVLQGHAVEDITAISCTDGTTTWNLIGSLTQVGANVKARIGGLTDGFFTIPAPLTITLPCTVTYATAGTYTTSTSMVDVVSPLPERVVSADIPGTATVYAKPVITPTNLGGPFDAGVPETVSLSIANASIPEPFEVVFTYPAGTVIVYDGVTYTCTTTCPPIPVELTAEPTVLDFTVTFDEAWTGDVSVSLFDSNWTTLVPDRLLASASETGAVVNGGFVLTGTFSMQGRASRAGIPVTLTWGGTLATYGPSASTSEVISNNFTLTLTYGGNYTLTTLQPRYLNVTTALGKTITALAANRTMLPLELKGGNAYWRVSLTELDNIIDTSDAGIVGGQYGTAGSDAGFGNHGDCNFDGKVNIQDLALVGGNYDLTSTLAYPATTWMP